MDLEDIPVLRHIRLAGGILKFLLIIFGWVIPLLLCLGYISRLETHAFSREARWFFTLRAIALGAWAWGFLIIGLGLIANIIDMPGPFRGNWLFITWIYSKLTNAGPDVDYALNDILFSAGFGIVMYAWSWYFGKENGSGDFITHESYEDGLRRLRADPLSPYDREQAERAERKEREKQ